MVAPLCLTRPLTWLWNVCQINMANMNFWNGILQLQIYNSSNSQSIPRFDTSIECHSKHKDHSTHGGITPRVKFTKTTPKIVNYDSDPRVPIVSSPPTVKAQCLTDQMIEEGFPNTSIADWVKAHQCPPTSDSIASWAAMPCWHLASPILNIDTGEMLVTAGSSTTQNSKRNGTFHQQINLTD